MVLEVWVYGLFAAWLVLWALGYAHVPSTLRRSWPAWVVLGAWLALQTLEIVPMPREVVQALNPQAASMESLVETLGVKRDTMTISVDPFASRVSPVSSTAGTLWGRATSSTSSPLPRRIASISRALSGLAVARTKRVTSAAGAADLRAPRVAGRRCR